MKKTFLKTVRYVLAEWVSMRYLLKNTRESKEIKINNILVIHLENRRDRESVIIANEQRHPSLTFRRFSAIAASPGGLGCALSHIAALASCSTTEYAAIMEDDFLLEIGEEALMQIVSEFMSNSRLDILCLGHNTSGKQVSISESLNLTTSIQTASFYIVKRQAIAGIIEAFARSIKLYARGLPYETWAIDQQWKVEQRKRLLFAVPKKKIGYQVESFSDIEGKIVSYGR